MAELNITKKEIEEMKCYLTQEIEYYNREAREYMCSPYPKDLCTATKDLEKAYMFQQLMKLVLKYEKENEGEKRDGEEDSK